jgi:hypothetical protein
MQETEELAIWLHDEAAKLIFGIDDPNHPASRWSFSVK